MVTSNDSGSTRSRGSWTSNLQEADSLPGHPCRHLRRFAAWPQVPLNLVRNLGRLRRRHRANSRWAMHRLHEEQAVRASGLHRSVCASHILVADGFLIDDREWHSKSESHDRAEGDQCGEGRRLEFRQPLRQKFQATHWTTPVSVKPMAPARAPVMRIPGRRDTTEKQPHP